MRDILTIKVDGVDKLSYSYEEPAPTTEQSRISKEASGFGDARSFIEGSVTTRDCDGSSKFEVKKQTKILEFNKDIVKLGNGIIAAHPGLIGSDEFEWKLCNIPVHKFVQPTEVSHVMWYIEQKHAEAMEAVKAADKN
jgi:hypothetical protein